MWEDTKLNEALCAAMFAHKRGDKAEATKSIDRVIERVKISYRPSSDVEAEQEDWREI